ncbi:hypothetical protein L484_026868 [Morus notabilis]|uniref:Protein RALF-like 32 n=1 Tax=Morus notabilis TaxID=981085 RepID=W9RGM1_9ROSA|nr:hypothetical protein L484_026868 [Morus notabilis]
MGSGWKIKKRTHSLLLIMLIIMFFSSVPSEYCSAEIGETNTNKRVLLGGKLISPVVLRRDLPFCRSSGHLYAMSCLPQPSNPRNRGCSSIYRCRTGK